MELGQTAAAHLSLVSTDTSLGEMIGTIARRRNLGLRVARDAAAAREILENRTGLLRIFDCGRESPLSELERRSVQLCGRPTDDLVVFAGQLSDSGANPTCIRSWSWARKAFVERAESVLGELLPAPAATDPERWLLGASESIAQIRSQIRRVARFPDVSVLVRGETGTGKERVARALHELGCPAGAPLVAVNCAAIPATLFESELFGHEAGSFTGAARSRVGLFEMAAEGTVFLDEVGELPMELQPKLLRALETREFRRVGGSKNIPLRARVVSATNRGLHGQADSTLRPDLHFRLAGFTITMPALRERPGDIELLARHFAAAFAERHGVTLNLGEDALTLFRQHDWPGNVRELKATVEHGAILSENGRIGSDVLRHAEPRGLEAVGASVRPAAPSAPSSASEAGEKRTQSGLRAIERDLILAAWKESGHNLSLAARILGIPRNTLRDKLRRLSAA